MVDHDDHDDKYDVPTQCIHFFCNCYSAMRLDGMVQHWNWWSYHWQDVESSPYDYDAWFFANASVGILMQWHTEGLVCHWNLLLQLCLCQNICHRGDHWDGLWHWVVRIRHRCFAACLGENHALERMAWKKNGTSPFHEIWDIRREMAQQLAEAGCNLKPKSAEFCSMAMSICFCN